MRDRVRLAADIYLPSYLPTGDRLPTILCQTRYHRRTSYRRPFGVVLDPLRATVRRFVSHGYAFVIVDVRGTGASFGRRAMEWSPEEVCDGAEIVDWIIHQPWSDGAVGVTGTSYAGTAAELMLSHGHPAVKAACVRFALFDIFADITNPGGVRNRHFLEEWHALNTALDKNELGALLRKRCGRLRGMAVRGVAPVDGDADESLLTEAVRQHQANYNMLAAALSAEFRDDEAGGISFDQFSPHAFRERVEQAGTAIYSWTGYYDGANTGAAVKRFLNVRTPGSRLILGPWDHGGVQNPNPFSYTAKSRFDHGGEVLRFFDLHLRGIKNGMESEPPVHYFTTGEEKWKAADTWPPPSFGPVYFYLAEGGRLSEKEPAGAMEADNYRVDYTAGSGRQSRWESLVNLGEARIGYGGRKQADEKLLVYDSERLEHAIEVTGHPVVRLYVRADAADLQLFVYLEDLAPDGKVHYITEGLFRAIHRRQGDTPYRLPAGVPAHSFRRGDSWPLAGGEAAELCFDLLPISHLFQRGHAIRVAIAGADADNFELPAAGARRIEVMRNSRHPSHIVLPGRVR